MALTEGPTSEVVYTFRDMEGTNGRVQLHYPNGFDAIGFGGLSAIDELEVYAVGNFAGWVLGSLPNAVANLSDCGLYRASISQRWYEDVIAAGTGEAEQWGVYQFEDEIGTLFEISVPDPPEAILQPNLRYIDSTHADVVAFVDEVLLNSIIDDKAEIHNEQGKKATRLTEAWKVHKESQRETYRRTG